MRLKPALIMLSVFVVVIGTFAYLVVTYEGPTSTELQLIQVDRLFPELDPAAVQVIELVSPQLGPEPVVIERAGVRKWRMTRPDKALASEKRVRALLARFVALEAAKRGYVTGDFEPYELARPRYRVALTMSGGEQHMLTFGTKVAPIAAPGSEEYMDFYTLDEAGGSRDVIPHRYTRVGDRSQVLIVKDDVCPLIQVKSDLFREPGLVYSETADGTAPLDVAKVEAARISVRDGEETRAVAFRRTGATTWRLTEPVDARANGRNVSSAIRRLLALHATSSAAYPDDDPKDLAAFGLDRPSVLVELKVSEQAGAKPADYSIRFGRMLDGKDDLAYAQSSSRKSVLAVMSEVPVKELSERVEFFRDKRLVVVEPDALGSAAFEYGTGRPRLAVARRAGEPTKWRLEEPFFARAKNAAVESLLSAALRLSVQPGGFVAEKADDLGRYGLDKPRLAVRFTRKGEAKPFTSFLIGASPTARGKQHLVYAKNADEPAVVLVDRAAIGALSPDAATLRATVLLEGFDRWSAAGLQIVRGGKTVRLKSAGRQGWTFVEPEGLKASYTEPSDFLGDLADLKIEAWPADRPKSYAPFVLDPPYAVVTATTRAMADEPGGRADAAAAAKTFVVHFGQRAKNAKRLYVRLPGEPNVYEVKADILAKIDRGCLEFRDTQVLAFDPAAVKGVRVEGGRAEYDIVRARGGEWLLRKPVPVLGDAERIKGLLDALAGLRAKRLVAEGDLARPAFGLKPAGGRPYRKVVIQVELKAAAKTFTLLVGFVVPEGEAGDRYAVIAEDNIVFVMGAEEFRTLDDEFVTHQVMDLTRAGVAKVAVVHRDGSKVEVARRGADWTITSHKELEADEDRVTALIDAVRSITAERYATYDQKDLAKYGLAKPLVTLTVTAKDQLPTVLKIGDAAKATREDEAKTHYATGGGIRAVFLVSEDQVKRVARHVEDLIRKKNP